MHVVWNDLPGHITRARDNLVVIKEAAARQVSIVSRQLAAHTHVSLTCLEAVDRTDVVKSAACDKVSRRSVGTRHNPA